MENWFTEREQGMPKGAGRRNWEKKINTKEQLGEVSVHLVCLDIPRVHVAGEGGL